MAANHLQNQALQMAIEVASQSRRWKEEKRLMNEAMDELEGQRNQLYRLLARTQMALASTGKLEPDSSSILSVLCGDVAESDPGDTWLPKGWLSTTKIRQELGSVEELWLKQHYETALKELERLLMREDLAPDTRINAKLLKSCILRDNDQAPRALTQANEALDIAKRYGMLYDLRGKARFHLGMCQFEAGHFREAHWSFSLSSFTKGHANEIQVWKMYAEQELQKQS
ncbi:hypothetical protein EV356DRAFT_11999 [Viridothelium virens]|uniref:Uncharacterized protein n=1 Tax=Viridothelium virens TaxID=1048519 RepID=A0A6A6HQ39_VIRVR|nr:hypothetical protein EV356DRAFT_11999 [Viridothelium virens]